MSHLLQTQESPCLPRWAGLKGIEYLPMHTAFQSLHPPYSPRLSSVFPTKFMNDPGLGLNRDKTHGGTYDCRDE
jgi:hypothetical protein